jgi:uncharacterized protein (PEP-CTERM system associated)
MRAGTMLAEPMILRVTSRKRLMDLPLFAAGVLMIAASPVFGANLKLSKQLSTKLTYSDNLNRANARGSGGFIWEVVPGFVFNADGRRLDADIAYAAQSAYETGDGAGGRGKHRLQADLVSELYAEHIFLDVNVTGRQELIDSFTSGAFDTAGLNDNQQTTWTYRIKPSYRQRFGRFSDVRLDLETNGVFYTEAEHNDSQGYAANGRLTSGAFWQPVFSELRIEYKEDQYQSAGSNRFAKMQCDAGYRVDRRWRFLASAGYESNDYLSVAETSGQIWGLGLDWTPTARTQLSSRAEHHYYGWAPTLELSHRSKRSRLKLSYLKEIETVRSQRLQQSVFRFKDAFGDSVVPDFGSDSGVSGTESATTWTAYTSERLEIEYTIQTRRSVVSTGLSYQARDYELQEDEEIAEGRVSWTRRLSEKTTASLLLRLNDRRRGENEKTGDAGVSLNEYAVDLGLRRKLSERLSASLDYGFRNYEDGLENRMTASLSLSW